MLRCVVAVQRNQSTAPVFVAGTILPLHVRPPPQCAPPPRPPTLTPSVCKFWEVTENKCYRVDQDVQPERIKRYEQEKNKDKIETRGSLAANPVIGCVK